MCCIFLTTLYNLPSSRFLLTCWIYHVMFFIFQFGWKMWRWLSFGNDSFFEGFSKKGPTVEPWTEVWRWPRSTPRPVWTGSCHQSVWGLSDSPSCMQAWLTAAVPQWSSCQCANTLIMLINRTTLNPPPRKSTSVNKASPTLCSLVFCGEPWTAPWYWQRPQRRWGVGWEGWVINLTVLGLEFCESQHYNVKETESVSGEQGQCGRWWNYSLSEERNTQK